MKTLLIAAMLMISTSAFAGEVKPFTGVSDYGSTPIVIATGINSPSNKTGAITVPTGTSVAGCTYRRANGEQVCEPNSVSNLRKDGPTQTSYPNAYGSESSGQ